MNLELLSPFRKQIPDRVDSTLDLPNSLHHTVPDEKNPEWKAAYHLSFNRRGTYLAVGYATGTVAVHDFLSRTLSAVYPCNHPKQQPPQASDSNKKNQPQKQQKQQQQPFPNGITSVSWSRRSRTILVGAVEDSRVRIIDTTHPLGPEECSDFVRQKEEGDHHNHQKEDRDNNASHNPNNNGSGPDGNTPKTQQLNLWLGPSQKVRNQKVPRTLPPVTVPMSNRTTSSSSSKSLDASDATTTAVSAAGNSSANAAANASATSGSLLLQERHEAALRALKKEELRGTALPNPERYPYLELEMPANVGGSLQIHPKDPTAGLAVLANGTLVVFRAPASSWIFTPHIDESMPPTRHKVVTLWGDNNDNNNDNNNNKKKDSSSSSVTCAAFSHVGNQIYLTTSDGQLIGLDVQDLLYQLSTTAPSVPEPQTLFCINFGSSSAWHLLVSRNGKHLLLNCADGALRMYSTQECCNQQQQQQVIKPKLFQDVVSKHPFACCDLSGDGEYLVGGCDGRDDKYVLYLWNTATGALLDKLTGGAQVSLYSVAWHPTRSFLAVATSDGLVDVWGPRMDWTAFAPDFQALPNNVEYVEQEDEFDVVVVVNNHNERDVDNNNNNSNGLDLSQTTTSLEGGEEMVNVVRVDPVPVFASDSESESDVFIFETKVHNIMTGRGRIRGEKAMEDKD